MSSSAITGPVFSDNKRAPSGTAAAPSFAFNDSTGTGVYLVSAGVLGLSTAGVQRVVVDASGNVGIGTASPAYNLTVSKNGGGGDLAQFVRITDTNTANSVGPLHLTIGATNHFASAPTMVLSGTNGIAFGVGDGSDLAAQRKVIIDASGNLLVGTTNNTFNAGVGVKLSTNSMGIVRAESTNATSGYHMYSTGAGAFRFYVADGGTIFATSTTITGISDERLKENIRDLDDGLSIVLALKPRKFDWKESKGKNIKNDRGFIAQEFEQVLPDMVEEWKDPAPEGEESYKAVNANLIPTLVKAIQELEARLAALEAK